MKKGAAIKILHLIPHLGSGGAQKVFSQLSKHLQEKYEIDLYTFDESEKEHYIPALQYKSLQVNGGSGLLAKFSGFISRIKKLSKIKRSEGYTVSISHLEGADLINVITGKADKKIIVQHGSKRGDVKYQGIYHWLRQYFMIPTILRKADVVVCVSQGLRNEIVQEYNTPANKVRVIYNYFDHEALRRASEEAIDKKFERLFSGGPILINCARLDIQKNQAGLLDVFAAYKTKNPLARLLILGDGSLKEMLIGYSRALGLCTWENKNASEITADHEVFFLGNTPNPFPYIKRADLFLLTSGWEGFPLSIGEAMIVGTPVMSTDCPTGPREFICSEYSPPANAITEAEITPYGVLMPLLDNRSPKYSNTLKCWSDTILRVMNNPEQKAGFSKNAAIRMAEFSKEKIIAQWEKVIEK